MEDFLQRDQMKYEVIESVQKFEDLLISNNLFVDYFNEFLLNPGLGEKVKFNFMSGDLELIEGDEKDKNEKMEISSQIAAEEGMKNLVKNKLEKPHKSAELRSTAEGVKSRLESQLKSILRSASRANFTSTTTTTNPQPITTVANSSMSVSKAESFSSNTSPVPARSNSELSNKSEKILKNRAPSGALNRAPSATAASNDQPRSARLKSAMRRQELFKQVNSHSFKDIDLIPIEPRIEPTELKDPIASVQAKKPIVNTRYLVNVLKKPYSMQWLRNRRLVLFLQSELYNEFKLAMILAQLAKFNNEYCKILTFFCYDFMFSYFNR